MNSSEEVIKHFGVKGMRWGVRKNSLKNQIKKGAAKTKALLDVFGNELISLSRESNKAYNDRESKKVRDRHEAWRKRQGKGESEVSKILKKRGQEIKEKELREAMIDLFGPPD